MFFFPSKEDFKWKRSWYNETKRRKDNNEYKREKPDSVKRICYYNSRFISIRVHLEFKATLPQAKRSEPICHCGHRQVPLPAIGNRKIRICLFRYIHARKVAQINVFDTYCHPLIFFYDASSSYPFTPLLAVSVMAITQIIWPLTCGSWKYIGWALFFIAVNVNLSAKNAKLYNYLLIMNWDLFGLKSKFNVHDY